MQVEKVRKKAGRDNPSPPGLRERKRLQTGETLARVGLRLFIERGFDQTALHEIAAAADVAPRTFFRYFASKEDIVTSWQDKARADVVAAIADQSTKAGPLAALEAALLSVMVPQGKEALAVSQLVEQTPALKARDQLKVIELESAMAVALIKRFDGKIDPVEADLLAVMAIGAIRVAKRLWLADGGLTNPVPYGVKVFGLLKEHWTTPGAQAVTVVR